MPHNADQVEISKPERSSLFLRSFCGSLALGFVILFVLQAPLKEDLFSDPDRVQRFLLIPEQDMLSVKQVHALGQPPVDIGIFGNSRSVAVGLEEFPTDGRRFFNYSVPGTSFRTSVSFLEYLVEENAAPKIALISLDNIALGFFGPQLSPDRLDRFVTVFDTMQLALPDSGVGRMSAVRAAWRQVWLEYSLLKQDLSFRRLERLFVPAPSTDRVVRSDGSISTSQAEEWADRFPAAQSGSNQILVDILKHDLARLAAIQSLGEIEVLIYESPLHQDYGLENAHSQGLRASFVEACRSRGLACRTIDDYPEFASGALWPDATHAPPRELGALLSRFVDEIGGRQ